MSTAVQPGPKAVTVQKQRTMTLRNLFESQRPEVAKLLPRGMDPDRLFRLALTECLKNPDLLECTAESWALALQTCAQQGLYPDSGLGYMYLVPRKKGGVSQVSAMRGYQGDIKLARNSGEIADIYAEVVHSKDEYKVTKGLDRNVIHIPYDGDDDPGALKACYGVAKLTSGETAFVTLSRRDVERHRASSETADRDWSPWKKHTEAMWKKTAIHELVKWLPKSSEAMEHAVREITGEGIKPIDTTAIAASSVPMEPRTGLEGLTAQLQEEAGGGAAEEPPTDPPKECSHPSVPPSKVETLEPGKSIVCVDCGQEWSKPAREPGSDDDEPTPREAVEALSSKAGELGQRKGQRKLSEQ